MNSATTKTLFETKIPSDKPFDRNCLIVEEDYNLIVATCDGNVYSNDKRCKINDIPNFIEIRNNKIYILTTKMTYVLDRNLKIIQLSKPEVKSEESFETLGFYLHFSFIIDSLQCKLLSNKIIGTAFITENYLLYTQTDIKSIQLSIGYKAFNLYSYHTPDHDNLIITTTNRLALIYCKFILIWNINLDYIPICLFVNNTSKLITLVSFEGVVTRVCLTQKKLLFDYNKIKVPKKISNLETIKSTLKNKEISVELKGVILNQVTYLTIDVLERSY